MHAKEGAAEARVPVRRIGVFIDYWYAYTSARQLFAAPGVPPPAWYGNVSPRAVAAAVVKHPPAGTRRSERQLGGLHLFVRHFDPELHRGQLERTRRWELEGAEVVVGPPREQGGPHWQGMISVALATAVAQALATGRYDTAVVFAGDGALWPLLDAVSGSATPSESIELATWIGPDGTVPTTLVQLPRVWCHRLGEATFKRLVDDRRPAQHPPKPKVDWRAMRKAGRTPPTTMAAAMAAAGLVPGSPGAVDQVPQQAAAEQASPVEQVPAPEPPPPAAAAVSPEPVRDEPTRGVRRIAQRLFGRGA